MTSTASHGRLGGSHLLRKAASDRSGFGPPVREDLRGKAVQLDAVDERGQPVKMELDAADAWRDTQQKLATYRRVEQALHDDSGE